MFVNYWNITTRNIVKHKAHTLINIFGLAAAIASAILLSLYAKHELTYDAFHVNADRIQLVYKERNTPQGVRELDDTWVPLLAAMRGAFPAIEDGVRIWNPTRWVEVGDKKFQATITYADPSLLDIFTFPLAMGDSTSALKGVNSMVLSQEMATKYFGRENPIGKRVTVNFKDDYLVTGVLAEVPENSSLTLDIVVPFASAFDPENEETNSNWGSSFIRTYLLLDKNTTAENLQARFPTMVNSLFGAEGVNGTQKMKLKLWPLTSFHHRNVNSDTTSYVLLGLAFAIILIASVNFMNLSTARGMTRAREIGIRKTLGAKRSQLVKQFLAESLILSTISLLLGAAMAEGLLPLFNSLYNLELSLNLGNDPFALSLLFGVGLVSGLLSGGYPAFILSGFKPIDALRGKIQTSSHGKRLQVALTIFQFSLAIMMIIGVVVVWQQVNHMKNQDLNFNPDQVLVVQTNLGDFEDDTVAATRIETFKNQVSKIPGLSSVASSMSVPGNYAGAFSFIRPENWQADDPLRMRIAISDDQYFKAYEMNFIAGRDFSREYSTENNAIIINETAMRDMALNPQTAIGTKVNANWIVVGVIKDFNFQSLALEIEPVIHLYRPVDNGAHDFISVKFNTNVNDVEQTLAAVERQWQMLDPSRPFTYFFIDENFDLLYEDIDNISTIIGYFSLLAIIIANFGLLGMASYAVVQRTKEIAIRKVFGASVKDIIVLLSLQFARPVILANVFAWPVAWYATTQWLEGFAYRTEINWLTFPMAGAVVLLVSLLTTSIQSGKAASTHPVEALNYE